MEDQVENSSDTKNELAADTMSDVVAAITNQRYQSDCFWGGPKGIKYGLLVGALPFQQLALYPDGSCAYFQAKFKLPKGASLTLKGEYPHARYFSCTVANQFGEGELGNGDNIRDKDISPDEGSVNPFLPGNSRDATPRYYTVHIVQGAPPENEEDRPKNTIYTSTCSEDAPIHIALRHYVSDIGYDGTGVVKLRQDQGEDGYGLPKVTLNLADGRTLTGSDMCEAVQASKDPPAAGYSPDGWLDLVGDDPNAPALPEIRFERFWNVNYSVTGLFETDQAIRVEEYPPEATGGFANNPDTIYLTAMFSVAFGRVIVIRGKMPTHPRTRRGDLNWPEDSQVRYWSLTSSGSAASGVGWETVFDETVPLDDDGYFTIVMSFPEDRPKNAIEENGVKWLDFGGGEGHYVHARCWVNCTYFRYQHPSEDWPESPAKIPAPTKDDPEPQDATIMKEYYPRARYMSKEEFEALTEYGGG